MSKKDGVVPSGSVSVHDEGGDKDTPSAQDTDKSGGSYLGDWKSREEAEKGISELKGLTDRQGNELGELRKQVQELSASAGGKGGKDTDGGGPEPKVSAASEKLDATLQQFAEVDLMDDGAEKNLSDLMKNAITLTAAVTKEQVLAETEGQVKGLLAQKDEQAIQDKFFEENPDFKEMQSQGILRAVKEKNTMHDDFSAFFAAKADSLAAQVQELTAQLEEAQKTLAYAEGDSGTREVFTKPGTSPRGAQKNRTLTRAERKQSALEAVRRAMARA
jgi:hypothetical protein